MNRPFLIRYTWLRRSKCQHGHSVATGTTRQNAERRFQKQNPHITVLKTP